MVCLAGGFSSLIFVFWICGVDCLYGDGDGCVSRFWVEFLGSGAGLVDFRVFSWFGLIWCLDMRFLVSKGWCDRRWWFASEWGLMLWNWFCRWLWLWFGCGVWLHIGFGCWFVRGFAFCVYV